MMRMELILIPLVVSPQPASLAKTWMEFGALGCMLTLYWYMGRLARLDLALWSCHQDRLPALWID